MNQTLDEHRRNPTWTGRIFMDRNHPRRWEGHGQRAVRQREGRFQRENDAVLVLERQPVMTGVRRVQMMGFAVAVDHPPVIAVFVDLMDVLSRRQRKGCNPEREHGRYNPG